MLSNSPFDFWAWAQGGRYNTFAFRGAQIDRFGNVNNTVIGPYDEPNVRLPGGGGMADLGCLMPTSTCGPPPTTRTFVATSTSDRDWVGATAATTANAWACPVGHACA